MAVSRFLVVSRFAAMQAQFFDGGWFWNIKGLECLQASCAKSKASDGLFNHELLP